MDTILFVDSENFFNKIEDILEANNLDKTKFNLSLLDFEKLFKEPLKDFSISKKIFYTAKIEFHPETPRKSNELINFQRKLRNTLLRQKFEFIIAGRVRGQKVNGKLIFKEKGVDVRIAVDLISLACDSKLKTAIICSSDSDLQPAVKEVRRRGIEVIYLGFELNPNQGLTATTNRTILIRNSEVIEEVKKT